MTDETAQAAPAETPAAAPVEPAGGQAVQSDTGGDPAVQKPGEFPPAALNRISELSEDRRTFKSEAEYWRNRAEQLEKPAEPAAPAPDPLVKPDPAQFDSTEAYLDAQTEYAGKVAEQRANDAAAKAFDERDKRRKKEAAEQQATETKSQFEERCVSFAKDHADFIKTVTSEALPVSAEMTEIATHSADGPAMLYWLGKNPGECARLSRLSGQELAMEMGVVRAKAKETPNPETSGAPDPVEPLGGDSPSPQGDPEKMSGEEYVAWREAGGGR